MRKPLDKKKLFHLSSENLTQIYRSFDVVGSIAITRLPFYSIANARKVAGVIMAVNRNVKTVLLQTTPVSGDLRIRNLVYVAGENTTRTIHKEFGCLFYVDLAKCYFSPRLSYERMRIAKMVEPNEKIVNMFAGVGCFSIVVAKHSKPSRVFSIDLNEIAFDIMQENIRMNRVYDKVFPFLGDSREIIHNRLQDLANRVLMPLPAKALEYLPYAISALKKSGGWIHYYDFEHAAKTDRFVERLKSKLSKILKPQKMNFEVPFVRIVRSIGPNWLQLVADVHIL